MQKSKHTEGPWMAGYVADSEKRPVWVAIERDGFAIATAGRYQHNYNKRTRPVREISDAEVKANAHLIAAAPELLEALHTVKQWFAEWEVEVGPAENTLLDAVDEAIKKAESE